MKQFGDSFRSLCMRCCVQCYIKWRTWSGCGAVDPNHEMWRNRPELSRTRIDPRRVLSKRSKSFSRLRILPAVVNEIKLGRGTALNRRPSSRVAGQFDRRYGRGNRSNRGQDRRLTGLGSLATSRNSWRHPQLVGRCRYGGPYPAFRASRNSASWKPLLHVPPRLR